MQTSGIYVFLIRRYMAGFYPPCHHTIFAVKASIRTTTPTAALYSRCLQYKSHENTPCDSPKRERRGSNRIYKITEIVDGRQVVRYRDKRPATGTYSILAAR